MLARDRGDGSRPADVAIIVHRPYTAQKALLVCEVARCFGCMGVRHLSPPGTTTEEVHVVGFASDLEMVETLVTSLLVQLSGSMLRGQPPSGSPSASAAVASVVHRRLHRDGGRAPRGAASGRGGRRHRVDHDRHVGRGWCWPTARPRVEQDVRRRYPRLRTSRISSGSSHHGRRAGQDAGRVADLGGSRPGRHPVAHGLRWPSRPPDPGDPQVAAVYAAEDDALGRRRAAWRRWVDLEAYVESVLTVAGLVRAPVAARRSRSSSSAGAGRPRSPRPATSRPPSGSPPGTWTAPVVLHELAHLLAPADRAPRPSFCGARLWLVRRFLGFDALRRAAQRVDRVRASATPGGDPGTPAALGVGSSSSRNVRVGDRGQRHGPLAGRSGRAARPRRTR